MGNTNNLGVSTSHKWDNIPVPIVPTIMVIEGSGVKILTLPDTVKDVYIDAMEIETIVGGHPDLVIHNQKDKTDYPRSYFEPRLVKSARVHTPTEG